MQRSWMVDVLFMGEELQKHIKLLQWFFKKPHNQNLHG